MTQAELLIRINWAKLNGGKILDLSSCGLTSLPEGIGQLNNLKGLYLFNNKLTSLPEGISQFNNLLMLDLSDNYMTSLSEGISQLNNLVWLNLSGNYMTGLPESLLSLAERGTLKALYLHNNDALGIPPEILGATWREVANNEKYTADPREILRYYFAKRRAGKARPLNEAKVLFIGEAEVGKSSLIAALKEGHAKRDFDKTHGIVREKWWPNGEEDGALRLNLWDFGGQEVYHSTHTFFLTERAIYVVVVSARDNDAQNNIEYWLQMARSFGRGASIIVAVNKADQHHDGPDIHQLRRTFGADLRFIRTSCWTGEGLDELKATICRYVNDDPEVRREMPASWLLIKDALETMTQETLPLTEYRKLCVEHGETDEKNQDLLLNLWHRLGAVLYFRDAPGKSPAFGSMGILNPEWVTKGVYAVLDDKSLRERNGILTEEQLWQALESANYSGSQPHFIEAMMRKFELVYDAPDRNPREMLVPRLLEEKEPEFEWPTDDVLRFEYRYEVLPAGLLPRFIVRRHGQLSKTPKPWRHGCVLEVRDCKVLVRSNREAKKVEIIVDGDRKLRRYALDYIRHTFEDIHDMVKDLPVDEYLAVPYHPDAPMLKYSHLLKLESNGITIHHAEGKAPGEIIEVEVREALGSVRTPEREQREQAMQTTTIYNIERVERMAGSGSIYENSSQMHFAPGNYAGNFNAIAGNDNTNTQTAAVSQSIIQEATELAADPEKLLRSLETLRDLIGQARAAGAKKANCNFALAQVEELAEAARKPENADSSVAAKEAVAILAPIGERFKALGSVGADFEEAFLRVAAALSLLLQTDLIA